MPMDTIVLRSLSSLYIFSEIFYDNEEILIESSILSSILNMP